MTTIQGTNEEVPLHKVEIVTKVEHPTVAELHCSKPYRERRVNKSIVYLVGALAYLGTMAGFTIYYSKSDLNCNQIYE